MKSVEVYWKPHCNTKEMPEHSLQFQFFLFSVESNENTRESSSTYTKFHTKYCGNFMPNQSSIYFERKKKRTHTEIL